ncbi:MAG: hypothetical protein MJZ34_06780 [Paludibacteraceae bacterium]|nr:hypothetical protein [Paludibacteraceae bacterium]
MTKRRSQKKEKSTTIKKKTSIIISLLVVLFLGILVTYMFKPQFFRSISRRIERVINKNPQNSDVIFPENEIIGIDVSLYQEDIDWSKAVFKVNSFTKTLTKDSCADSHAINFVFAKATEGITITDSKYQKNKKGAESRNIPFGAYHFFSVTSDPAQQATHFIKTANLKAGNFLPVLDVEYQGRLSKKELRRRVLIWLKAVEKHYGRKPIIYTYANFHDEIFDTKEFSDYYFWMAHYGVSQPRHDCKFWQFTEEGVVYGITGYVDIDIFLGNKKEFNNLKLK